MSSSYDETYYERGVQAGISGYQNYRWLPEQTMAMCEAMVKHLNISNQDTILDFGCAKGFLVKAFTRLGFECYGLDVSEYAISNADEEIKQKLSLIRSDVGTSLSELPEIDIIICKDVLEHVPYDELPKMVDCFFQKSKKLFVVVPLAKDGKYIIPEYEKDITHIVREDVGWWTKLFENSGYKVRAELKVGGVKDNWSHFEDGNGFFFCER